MSCSCRRQGRPNRSNPNTRHARLESRLDRRHGISVSPRSPSVPGRSFPRAGYQITLAVEAAGIWALKHRPSSRALQILDASCSTSATFLLESHYSTRHLAQPGRWTGPGGPARGLRLAGSNRASPVPGPHAGALAPPVIDICLTAHRRGDTSFCPSAYRTPWKHAYMQ